LRTIFEKIYYGSIETITRVGILSIFFTISVICLNVMMRYLFKKSYPWAVECVELAMLVTVSSGIIYCAFKEGHICLHEISERYLFKRIICGLECILALILTGTAFKFGMNLLMVEYQTTMVLSIPIFPFVFFTGFCFILLLILFLVYLFKPR